MLFLGCFTICLNRAMNFGFFVKKLKKIIKKPKTLPFLGVRGDPPGGARNGEIRENHEKTPKKRQKKDNLGGSDL